MGFVIVKMLVQQLKGTFSLKNENGTNLAIPETYSGIAVVIIIKNLFHFNRV